MWLRTSLGDLRLVFFLYTSLEISPKLGYILYVCALARLISASSKRKNASPYRLQVINFKFKHKNDKAKYREMIFRVLKQN